MLIAVDWEGLGLGLVVTERPGTHWTSGIQVKMRSKCEANAKQMRSKCEANAKQMRSIASRLQVAEVQ